MPRVKLVSKTLLFAIVALTLCAALAVPASAAELTVGASGQYRTIQQAVNAAKPGDSVLIGPGNYTENVLVNKPLTLAAADQSAPPVVQAADSGKEVLLIQSDGVRIQGLRVTGGTSGVAIEQASNCTITNCIVNGNVFGVYMIGATSNTVSNSNLNSNGFGIYLDGSARNTLSGNSGLNEKGGGGNATYSDAIYLYYSDSNSVTQNNLSANHVYGISLFHSSGNTISNNTISANDDIGVRLGEASDNNTLSFNTVSGNGQLGILILNARSNQIYLNNFISQPSAMTDASAAVLNSPEKMAYTYGGIGRTSFMSNYYSDYKGTDVNGSGIGSTPSTYGDTYPLIRPLASYGTIVPASAVTATPLPANQSTSTAATNQSSMTTSIPGFQAGYAIAGLVIVALILGRRYRTR
ncbi:MAG TPA: NosD domain-containing protein [Candidatus Bathyarchaeia archaeon]|nr:NosD domain-containing protein [Candidatus Bathyarchaeia archaeon]